MKSIFTRIVAGIILISYSSCATIFTGTTDNVGILSEPAGGKVYVNGNYMGNTPTTINLKRDKDYNIMVKKDGYEPGSAILSRSFNAVAILNLIAILCWVVDIVSGGMWKFDRDAVTVTLDPVSGTKSSSKSHGKNTVVAGENMTLSPYNGKTALLLNAKPAN